jgi:hypothetical protein
MGYFVGGRNCATTNVAFSERASTIISYNSDPKIPNEIGEIRVG